MTIDRDKVLLAAQRLVEKKRYDKAIVEYQKIVADDPSDARTLLKIGDLELKMGSYADAIGTYEKVGRFYAGQGFSLKAIAVYKQIREIIQKHVPSLEDRYAHISPKLAELYQQLGLTSDALAALDEHAIRLMRLGRVEEAIDVLRRIVELDPINPLPHLRLAEALSRIKDADGAATEFGMAAAQLIKHGRYDDALKVLEHLLHHRHDPVPARMAAELYLARGGPKDGLLALAKLQLCFQINPKDLEILGLLARAFETIGQKGKAFEVQKEMARIPRDQGEPEFFEGIVRTLMRIAPDDEGVQQLAQDLEGASSTTTSNVPAGERLRKEAASNRSFTDLPPASRQEVVPYVPRRPDARHAPAPIPADGTSFGVGVATRPPVPAAAPQRLGSPPANVAATGGMLWAAAPGPFDLDPETLDPDVLELASAGVRRRQRFIQKKYEEIEEIEEIDAEPDDEEEHLEQTAPIDVLSEIEALLDDAAALRKRRLWEAAIDTLHAALELDPRNVQAHLFLHEVFLEADRPHEALEKLFAAASLQLEALDGESGGVASSSFGHRSGNAQALSTLEELGYDVTAYRAEFVEEEPLVLRARGTRARGG